MASNPPTPNPSMNEYTNEVGKVFAHFDTDGDGKISAEELAGILEALGSSISPDEVDHVMQEIDTNDDGDISLHEFLAFYNISAGPYGDQELREAFNLNDQDSDGKISVAERSSDEECAGMTNGANPGHSWPWPSFFVVAKVLILVLSLGLNHCAHSC